MQTAADVSRVESTNRSWRRIGESEDDTVSTSGALHAAPRHESYIWPVSEQLACPSHLKGTDC